MKPNNNEAALVESSITGETGQFTVDENSLAHIMSVLTNLYADSELAVIREYLTNAYDAHIDAGMEPGKNWTPIEVTTPSHFNKSYIIKDYGVGMSADDLKNTYSKYGASTKRDSDKVVGMLGLGSKSALTYTNSFTITAVKAGRITKAIVSINEEGVPVFHIVHEAATDLPNGVEISIPVKDRNTFAAKTAKFVKYWPDGIVTIDGSEPEKHGYEFIKAVPLNGVNQSADVYVVPSSGSGYYAETPTSYVIMGNVPYQVDPEYVPSDLNALRVGFVAYVPIGSVSIVPSREKLYYNNRTKDVIDKIGAGLAAEIVKKKQEEIEQAASFKEAWLLINTLSYEMRNTSAFRSGVTYKGETWEANLKIVNRRVTWDWNDRSDESGQSSINLQAIMVDNEPLFVIDAPVDDTYYYGSNKQKQVSPSMRRKARHVAVTKGLNNKVVYFFKDNPTSPWLAHITRVTWTDVENTKVPRTNSAPRPKEIPYDVWRFMPAKPAKFDKKGKEISPATAAMVTVSQETTFNRKGVRVFYISPADMAEQRWKRGTDAKQLLHKFADSTIELVVMGSNRFDKFLRDAAPGAQHIKEYAKEYVNKQAKALGTIHLIVDKFENDEELFCQNADYRAIDDPELADFIKNYQENHDANALSRLQGLTNFLRYASIDVDVPEAADTENPFDNYPLIKYVGGDYVEHLYTYINAQYAKN